jgi:hypothetical protein
MTMAVKVHEHLFMDTNLGVRKGGVGFAKFFTTNSLFY